MTEETSRPTRKLSRQTIQLMLEMKSLLRRYSIMVSLASPDAYEQLIQASEAIDDEEIGRLRKRLVEIGVPSTRFVAQEPLREDVPSPETNTHAESSQAAPICKTVYLRMPHETLLTCEQCQGAIPVKVVHTDATQPLYVQCPCGMQYQVVTEQRQYSRVPTRLPGLYIDLIDEQKAGAVVVEDISFGGIRFRTTSPHTITRDDRLYVQFVLDDEHETFIWEQVCVSHVYGNTVGAEFIPEENPDRALDIFVKLSHSHAIESLPIYP